MAVEKSGSKTDVVVKLVLVFFVCLLSFSIGTFVGKKFSDNQHKLAKFEPGSKSREVASADAHGGHGEAEGHDDHGAGAGHGEKASDALTDDEVAKLAEEFVSEEGHETAGQVAKASAGHGDASDDHGTGHAAPAKADAHAKSAPTKVAARDSHGGHGEDAHATQAADGRDSHSSAEPTKAAQRIAQNKSAEPAAHAAPAAKNRIPSSLPKEVAASAVGKFTVQVASYPDEMEAQRMAGDLKAKGFSAFYVSAKVKDRKTNSEKTWYRVSVGLFTTAKEAEAYKADLLARSKVTSAIVQKVVE